MELKHLNKDEFEQAVNADDELVVVDFFATWCGPCQMLAKELEALDKEQEAFRIVKVDIDENPGLTRQWEISTVPTVFMIKDGQVKDKAVGFLPKQLLKQKMENLA